MVDVFLVFNDRDLTRTPSAVYIDDVYPTLGAHDAVKNLTQVFPLFS